MWVSPPGLMRMPAAQPRGPLDPVDQLALVVRLDAAQLRARRLRLGGEGGVDLGEGRAPVDLGLARARAGSGSGPCTTRTRSGSAMAGER